MNEKYRIAIMVDHKWRDLPGYALLKVLLEKKYSCSVTLYASGWDRQVIPIVQPHLLLLPHVMSDGLVRLAQWARNHGALIGLLPTEGIPGWSDDASLRYAYGLFDDIDLSSVDFQFAWSAEIRRKIASWGLIGPEKILDIGAPRFDFHRPAFSRLRTSKPEFLRKYGLDPTLPTIAWATNFTYADMPTSLGVAHLTAARLPQPLSEQFVESSKMSRALTMDVIERFLEEHQNINFIIKPHPAEAAGAYEALMRKASHAGHNHVRVVHQEYIWDVLEATDILFQRNCTTAVEAWLYGKPTFELRFNDNDIYVNPERTEGCDFISNYDDLVSRFQWYLDGGAIPEAQREGRDRFLVSWSGKQDGNRTLGLADLLFSLLERNVRHQPFYSPGERARAWVEGSLKRYMKRGRRVIRTSSGAIHADKHMRPKDQRYWLKRVEAKADELTHLPASTSNETVPLPEVSNR